MVRGAGGRRRARDRASRRSRPPRPTGSSAWPRQGVRRPRRAARRPGGRADPRTTPSPGSTTSGWRPVSPGSQGRSVVFALGYGMRRAARAAGKGRPPRLRPRARPHGRRRQPGQPRAPARPAREGRRAAGGDGGRRQHAARVLAGLRRLRGGARRRGGDRPRAGRGRLAPRRASCSPLVLLVARVRPARPHRRRGHGLGPLDRPRAGPRGARRRSPPRRSSAHSRPCCSAPTRRSPPCCAALEALRMPRLLVLIAGSCTATCS